MEMQIIFDPSKKVKIAENEEQNTNFKRINNSAKIE